MHDDLRTVRIETAAVSDAAEIVDLQKLAFYNQAVLYQDFTLPPLVQTLDELLGEFTRYTCLKAVVAGRIVGSVRGRAEAGACFISRLMVLPSCQNRGIGKMLMRAIEEKFAAADRFELYTGHKSLKNLAFYSKIGYREYARKPQSDQVMLICMQKRNNAP